MNIDDSFFLIEVTSHKEPKLDLEAPSGRFESGMIGTID